MPDMPDVPTAAERARTILAATSSAQVTDRSDPLHAWMLPRVALSAEPLSEDCAATDVEVEIADAAPLPVRDRIRGRVRILGRAVEETRCDALHVYADRVVLTDGDARVEVPVADLLAAIPDPLHEIEATMLGHLDSSHADVLETLTHLVEPRHRQGVIRVWPYRLDRHGLVLRLEYAQGHHDQRLPFRAPLTSAQQLSTEMALMIARARDRRLPCARPVGARSLAPLLRAAAAAQRLCSPQREEPTA